MPRSILGFPTSTPAELHSYLNLAQGLENYAALLQKLGRSAEAAAMEARAEAIRAGRAE